MPKPIDQSVCPACGRSVLSWYTVCPGCDRIPWNTPQAHRLAGRLRVQREWTGPLVTILIASLMAGALVATRAMRTRRMAVAPMTGGMAVHTHRLANGLTLFLTENHSEPMIYAEVVVRAGSKQEPAEATGLAHFLEHLLFKGTGSLGTVDGQAERPHLDRIAALFDALRAADDRDRAAIHEEILAASREADRYAIPNELPRVYEALGASGINAHTSRDYTTYEIELPAHRLEQWAMLEADRFRDPRFRLFVNELQIVLEEKYEELDSDVQQLHAQVDEALAAGHPYGRSALGTVPHLRFPSLHTISAFRAAQYVPANMAIIMSGDLDIGPAIAVLEQHFSAWTPAPLPEPPVWQEDAAAPPAGVTVLGEQEEPTVMQAFRTVPAGDPDAPVSSVIDLILQNSDAGLLDDNLSSPKRVRSAHAFMSQYLDYGVQYLIATPKPRQTLEDAGALLLAQVDLLKHGSFDDRLLRSAISQTRTALTGQMETNEGRVSLIRDSYLAYGEWRPLEERFERIRTLTKRDVARVAARNFGARHVTGYLRPGHRPAPDLPRDTLPDTPVDPAARSAFAERVLAMPVPEAAVPVLEDGRDYRKIAYGPGIRLYYVPNPFNSLFSFTISVDTGTRHDPRWAVIEDLWEWADTPSLLQHQLDERLDELDADLSVYVSSQRIDLVLSGPDEHFADALTLMLDWVVRPRSTPRRLESVVEEILHYRETTRRDPEQLLMALAAYNSMRDRSWYRRQLPAGALAKLSVDELIGLMRGLLGHEHAIAYVGSLSPDRLLDVLRAKYPPPAAAERVPEYQPYRMEEPGRATVMTVDQKLIQAHVFMELPGGRADPVKQPVVLLLDEYLSSFADGLIAQRIRESQGAVYAVSASYSLGPRPVDDNSVFITFRCQAEKTPGVINAVRSLLADPPASPEQFAKVKRALLSKMRYHRVFFRAIPETVLTWEARGYARDPLAETVAALERVTLEDVQAFYRRHVNSRAAHISIVGDGDKIAFDRIAGVEGVRKLTLDEIFPD